MGKKYRDMTINPRDLERWKDSGALYLQYDLLERNRVATKRDIDRVKKLVAGGLPLPTVVLAERFIDGRDRYCIVYGAGLITAVLIYLKKATDKEKSTSVFQKFMQCEINTVVVTSSDNNDADCLFEAFKGFNRKG